MDGKGGIMMCKLNGRMDKGHYDVEMKGDGCKRGGGALRFKCSRVNRKGGIMMCKLQWGE